MRNTETETVAEHSFYVAVLTHALGAIRREVFGRQADVDAAVTLALFHDVGEVITGDIPTPVKHHNPAMQASMRDMEALAGDRLLAMVPANLREVYGPLIAGRPADEDSLALVKA